MEGNLKFELTDTQMEAYRKWCDEVLKGVEHDIVGSREAFVFIPCSRGVAVKVIHGEESIDLTEYDSIKKNN
jgi:hypothetical protein